MVDYKMKRILLVRPDGIGDFVIFTAVLEEYRRVFKNARIDLLCHPRVRDLVEAIPYFNKVYYVDQSKIFRKKYFLYTALVFILTKIHRYDLLFHPIYSRSKAVDRIVRWMRVDEKVFYDGDTVSDSLSKEILRNNPLGKIVKSVRPSLNEIGRNGEFINALGGKLQYEDLRTKFWYKEGDLLEFNKIIRMKGLELGKYACLFPGAGTPNRYWKDDNWVDLVEKILSEGLTQKIVFLGGRKDQVLNQKILRLFKNRTKILDLTGSLNLRILAKVIENSSFLVSVETAAIHIAAAVRTPNVCIIGGGHFGIFYPYGDFLKNRIVYKKMDCYGCNWECVYEKARCIQEIEVESVLKELRQLL